jgi:hypothetical protein
MLSVCLAPMQGRPFKFRAADSIERDKWWRCTMRVFRNHDELFQDDAEKKAVKAYSMIGRWRRWLRWRYLGDQSQVTLGFRV